MKSFFRIIAPIVVSTLHGVVDVFASTAKITIAKAVAKAVGITIDYGNAP